MAELHTDPFHIDINLVTSLDLQVNLTSYVKLIEKFPNESVLSMLYWHTDSHSDTITSKTEFFKLLNSGELQIKDNPQGHVKRDTTYDLLKNKNYRDQLPGGVQLKTDGDKYGKAQLNSPTEAVGIITTTNKQWVSLEKESDDSNPQINGKWEVKIETTESPYPVATLDPMQDAPPEVKSTIGMKDLTAWFKLWWIEKFNTAHDIVKQDLLQILGEDNEYFVKFSESVGQLKNLEDTRDTSTLPIWDINVELFGDDYSIPSIIPGVGRYITKPESAAFAQNISKYTNIVFRQNMSNMMEDPSRDSIKKGPLVSFPSMSHGNNFVHDAQHPNRLWSAAETITTVISEHLGGLYDVLDLLSNRVNYMTVDKPKQIFIKVEGFTQAIDSLKHRVQTYDTKTDQITNTRYGKASRFNSNERNSKILSVNQSAEDVSES